MRTGENLIRRFLGLGPAPDPVGLSCDKDGYFKLKKGKKLERDFIAWHREGIRAKLASGIARFTHRIGPRSISRYLGDAVGTIRMRWSIYRLREARRLVYKSVYVHDKDTVESEGWIEFPGGFLTVVIRATGYTRHEVDYVQEEWDRGRVTPGIAGLTGHDYVTLVVPGERVTPDLVRNALQRWYLDRYRYHRGHWTVLEQAEPEVKIAFGWE